MQTFLPYPDFEQTAKCLDNKRLGKQRVECFQILVALGKLEHGLDGAWTHHPAVLMWIGYENALKSYFNIISTEWVDRGFTHNMGFFRGTIIDTKSYENPPWLGNEQFHASHRAALLHKAPEHYRQFNWTEEPKLDYYWPTKEIG